jgi:hypothetical protein
VYRYRVPIAASQVLDRSGERRTQPDDDIGAADFLLPQLTVLKMWDAEANRFENRIEYASCREFQTESVFRTGLEPSVGEPAAPKKPVAIPPGITIKIGDAIEGQFPTTRSFPNGRPKAGAAGA